METSVLMAAAQAARLHSDNAMNDIKNAGTRLDHIRATALAIEADNVAKNIEALLDIQQNNPSVELDIPVEAL